MIGQYWAQPDYQRLTFPHDQIERRAETIGTCNKEHQHVSDKVLKLIELLETGPMSVSDVNKKLGTTWDSVEMLLLRAGNYDPRLWESKARVLNKYKQYVYYTYVGLGDIGELPENVEIII